MMILHMMLGLAAAIQAAPDAAGDGQAAMDRAAEAAKIAAEHCKARQFETVVKIEVDGKTRGSRIRMCGKVGQSDADWVRTLQDGADKIAANPKMPPTAKDQALAAIKAEIVKINGKPPPPTATADMGGYSILPPLAPKQAQSQPSLEATYSVLPPLVPKPPAPVASAAASLAAPPAARLSAPRLRVECLTPGDLGDGGECLMVERDTRMTVLARDAVPAGTSLRFSRRGETRAEVKLAQLRSGQARQLKLPIEVCAGGGGGRLDIDIVRTPASGAPQVVGSLGRYQLRC